MSQQPFYEYVVVTSNGAGVHTRPTRSFKQAREAASRLAERERNSRVKFGPYEIERVLQIGFERRYWMRQRKRWVLWDARRDADVRCPDFIIGERS